MEEQTLDRFAARKIIDNLKSGTTPLDAARHLDVGRERWYRGMKYYLEGAAFGGESKVRFIKGYYGDGKTHLMAMARHFALEQNFVVSYASAENTRLDKFEEVYKRIVRELVTPEGGGGIQSILRRWKSDLGSDVDQAAEQLRAEPSIDLNFRIALEGYLRAQEPSVEDQIVQWLHGEPVQLKQLGINRMLRPGDSRDMMRSLSVFLRHIGYSGLLVLLDELDRIQFLTGRQRQNSYQVLRELMDNTDGQGGMQGTLFYCAAPAEMFTAGKGFIEYDALRTRIEPALDNLGTDRGGVDYRGTIIDLERTPLTTDDYYEMARCVRQIHAHALDWNAEEALPDSRLHEIVDQIRSGGIGYGPSTPRLVATTIASIIDLAEQGQQYDVREEVDRAVDRAEQARIAMHHQAYED